MLKLWKGAAANNDSGCCNLGAAEDARRVADVLGIPFYVLNFADRFEATVIDDFHSEYAAGRTPNPCVRCNQWIKFDALLQRADVLGADVLATGHYARVRAHEGRYRLLRGADAAKDQSYVLWMLTQDELARCLFPVGEMTKTETRSIAAELGLRTAAKPDSQEICFVPDGDLDTYMAGRAAAGPIVDATGSVVGEHHGLGSYTVGQRKGLGISLGVPVYVTAIDPAANAVVVGSRAELAVDGFTTDEMSFVDAPVPDGTPVAVQHRAHGDVVPATIVHRNGVAEVRFDRPVEAVAPGQSAAFYSREDRDELLGGGIIRATVPAGALV
jgi:tRNA-specific 2-thiouridylase